MNEKMITDEQVQSALKQFKESENVVVNIRNKIAGELNV